MLAEQFPEVLTELRKLAGGERLPAFAPQFALRNPGRDPGRSSIGSSSASGTRSAPSPRRLGEVARTGEGVEALRRLVDRGLATLAGFTPSDAMHVLGRQHGWSVEAARLGAAMLATEERNASAREAADTPEGFCERTYQHVVREAHASCSKAHWPTTRELKRSTVAGDRWAC